MIAAILTWIRKQPVVAFYILAFSITWLGWLPQAAHSRGFFPFDSPIFYVLGGVGPLLAVLIMVRVLSGKGDYGEVFRPFLRWQVRWIWYVVALFGYPAIWLVTLVLSREMGTELAKLGTPLTLISTFLISFLAAMPEEIAWRGFALPRLQSRYTALASGVIVGVLWGLWHLPLLFNTDNLMSTYSLPAFLLDVVARSVIYVWIFNNTRGSLLFVSLFHAASNTAGSFLGFENLAVTYVLAAVLVIVFGATHLSRQGKRSVQTDVGVTATQAG